MFRWSFFKAVIKYPDAALEILSHQKEIQIGGRRPKGYDGPFKFFAEGKTQNFFINHNLTSEREKEILGEIERLGKGIPLGNAAEISASIKEKPAENQRPMEEIKRKSHAAIHGAAKEQRPPASKAKRKEKTDDGDGLTALMKAAETGDHNAVRRLILSGEEINARDKYGRTALIFSSINGHQSIVRALLEAGANPAICDFYGRNAAEAAAQHSNYECLDHILFPNSKSDKTLHLREGINLKASMIWDLAEVYNWGGKIDQDHRKALICYEEAFRQGSANAANSLFFMYQVGYGVDIDTEKAKILLQIAAERGHSNAQFDLGIRYLQETYRNNKETLATHWLERSAEQGNERAMLALAQIYSEQGKSFTNLEKARYWLGQASESGNSEAQEQLATLNKETPKEDKKMEINPICKGIVLGKIPTGGTNREIARTLQVSFPTAFKKAQDALVAIRKKNAGGSIFSPANARIRNAQTAIYALNNPTCQPAPIHFDLGIT
jgi:TPR repeat protein